MPPPHQMFEEEECTIYYRENEEFWGGSCNCSNSILADMPEFLAQNEGWDIVVEPEMIKRILLILHQLNGQIRSAGHALEFWKVHCHH